MPEYAFDIKLWAVCRVEAESESAARKLMLDHVQCLDISYDRDGVKLTEASIEDDSGKASELFEVDGEAI